MSEAVRDERISTITLFVLSAVYVVVARDHSKNGRKRSSFHPSLKVTSWNPSKRRSKRANQSFWRQQSM